MKNSEKPNCNIASSHAHMPVDTHNWHPKNNSTISEEAQAIAKVILASYDGLTLEQRKSKGEETANITSADLFLI